MERILVHEVSNSIVAAKIEIDPLSIMYPRQLETAWIYRNERADLAPNLGIFFSIKKLTQESAGVTGFMTADFFRSSRGNNHSST